MNPTLRYIALVTALMILTAFAPYRGGGSTGLVVPALNSAVTHENQYLLAFTISEKSIMGTIVFEPWDTSVVLGMASKSDRGGVVDFTSKRILELDERWTAGCERAAKATTFLRSSTSLGSTYYDLFFLTPDFKASRNRVGCSRSLQAWMSLARIWWKHASRYAIFLVRGKQAMTVIFTGTLFVILRRNVP